VKEGTGEDKVNMRVRCGYFYAEVILDFQIFLCGRELCVADMFIRECLNDFQIFVCER